MKILQKLSQDTNVAFLPTSNANKTNHDFKNYEIYFHGSNIFKHKYNNNNKKIY